MGRKNDRNRQSRLQRKRNKRAAARAARRQRAGTPGGSPWESPRETAAASCIIACGGLLAGCGRLAGEILQAARMARELGGGILGRLPFELEAFLYDAREWSLTCADLESVRPCFDEYDATAVFDRLWTLALTNEPDAMAFASAVEQDCPHRAALAFEELRACLDDPEVKPRKALRAIAAEIGRHSPPGTHLAKTYEDLLHTAIATVHASPEQTGNVLSTLASHCRKAFDRHAREQADAAWWHCGVLFLRDVLIRLRNVEGITQTTVYADLVTMLLDAPHAAVQIARSTGSAQLLRSVHFQSKADDWRTYLEREIDAHKLTFDDRTRYEIARLKLLRAVARHNAGDGPGESRETLAAFESLQGLLTHGVPPKNREIPGHLDSSLVDFYVETLRELHCEGVALRTTEDLLRRRPDDFRLACLYATGAVVRGDHAKLSLLARHIPRRHIDPELFAHCAMTWSHLPRGMKTAAAIRPNLFDPLDREHRKQCLIKLSQQCLRRAATVGGYVEELRRLLPYFERDNFVYRDLREKAAVESSLVFLATMMAPLHDLKLSLTEDQSQQWVSYAREIAQRSSLGSQLAVRYLTAPSRSFALAPVVRNSACAQLSDFQPPNARRHTPPPRAGRTQRTRRKRKHAEDTSTRQPGLFDAIDP
jgi:hypothetical protein